MIGATADGEPVEPAVSVIETPEGDACDGFAVLQVDAKDVCITAGELFLYLLRKTLSVRVGAFLSAVNVGDSGTAAGKDVDVEFGDHHLQSQRREFFDGFFNVLQRGEAKLEMGLGSDAIDGNPAF